MVWFSSAMDLKKLAFSDQFPYCVSPRRKVVSGFGLGVVASFIVLSVILLSVSFKAPFLNPMFQGFSSLGSSNTSFVSWPLSLSSTTGLSSSSTGTSSTTATNTTELQNSVDGNERVGKVKVVDQIHEANVSEIGKDGKYLDINGNGIVMEKTHVVNFSEKVENGSFTTEGGRIQEKTQKVNGEEIDKSANFSSSGGKGMVLENTHLGNFSEKVKNGSFIGGDVIAGEVVKRHANESSLGKYKIAENNNVGNLSYNEENVGPPSKVKASEINNGGISSGENNNAISLDDSQKMHNGECDIFDGKWVRDGTKPYYPPGSCPYIGRDFDCHLNRRPDDWFLKWKWQPNGCGIPSLNATDFLERLRGKKLVFVGDSLNRNMWESLVCILRHSVRNKKKVYEISGRREFKKKGFYAFRFEDYNCTVDFVGAPFLVRESSFNGRNGSFETLRLDLMDRTTSMYHDADVIVFNTGHWWTHEKTSRGEDYYQEGNHVYPRLKVLEAYKKALTTWARWVDKNIDSSRTQVIFRGYSVTHFRGGQWNSGGQCHKETEPIFNETYLAKYPSKMRVLEHVLNGMKTPVVYLNISRLTDYRKDGHPSIYRKEYKTVKEQIASVHSQDCSHWCLPGVPDTWNELLYASLLKVGKGSWRS